jgi:hypothetical protein
MAYRSEEEPPQPPPEPVPPPMPEPDEPMPEPTPPPITAQFVGVEPEGAEGPQPD